MNLLPPKRVHYMYEVMQFEATARSAAAQQDVRVLSWHLFKLWKPRLAPIFACVLSGFVTTAGCKVDRLLLLLTLIDVCVRFIVRSV